MLFGRVLRCEVKQGSWKESLNAGRLLAAIFSLSHVPEARYYPNTGMPEGNDGPPVPAPASTFEMCSLSSRLVAEQGKLSATEGFTSPRRGSAAAPRLGRRDGDPRPDDTRRRTIITGTRTCTVSCDAYCRTRTRFF